MSSVLPPGFPGRPMSDNLLRAIRHEARDIMDNQMTRPLPPSLQQICTDYKLPALMLPAVLRLTAEACRLQREADVAFARGRGAQEPREQAALVVAVAEELR